MDAQKILTKSLHLKHKKLKRKEPLYNCNPRHISSLKKKKFSDNYFSFKEYGLMPDSDSTSLLSLGMMYFAYSS